MTPARLREVLDYDPDTGKLTWKVTLSPRAPAGSEAGAGPPSARYGLVTVDGESLLAHRAAWAIYYGEFPNTELDHIDRDRRNNRITNLRLSNRTQQLHNTTTRSDNTSGRKGVSWEANGWRAYLNVGGERVHLGRFKTYEEASAVRARAESALERVFAGVVSRDVEEIVSHLKEELTL